MSQEELFDFSGLHHAQQFRIFIFHILCVFLIKMQSEEFYVRVRYKNVYRNVYFNTNDPKNYQFFVKKGKLKLFQCLLFQYESNKIFMLSAFAAHGVLPNKSNSTEVYLFDQLRTPIEPKMLEITLNNYKSWLNSSFYIEIRVDVADHNVQIEVSLIIKINSYLK